MNLTLNPYICRMLNMSYLLNKWLDNTLPIILVFMLFANVFLFLTPYIIIGVIFYIIVMILSILRLNTSSIDFLIFSILGSQNSMTSPVSVRII